MKLDDLIIEVRDVNLKRVGLLRHNEVELEASIPFAGVGSWVVRMSADHPLSGALRTPGGGLLVTDANTGVVLFSGPSTAPKQQEETEQGVVTEVEISGVTDDVRLSDYLVWTDPTVDLSDPNNSAVNVKYEITGAPEKICNLLVRNNMGDLALASRKIPNFTHAPYAGTGTSVTKEWRYATVLEALQETIKLDTLGFKIRQQGSLLTFSTYRTQDRTGSVRLAIGNSRLKSSSVSVEAPGVTHAVVAAVDNRAGYLEVSNTQSVDAGNTWHRRIERFVNGNMKGARASELAEVGTELLNESGFTNIAVQAVAVDHEQMAFGVDWDLGDLVSVEIGDEVMTSQISGFVVTMNRNDGFRMGMTLGDATGFSPTSVITARVADTARRVAALEKVSPVSDATVAVAVETAAPTGAMLPYAVATAPAGWLACDGQAVSRTTYAALYAAIGTTFGAGNGTTTFNVPDMRGRFPLGVNPDATSHGKTVGLTEGGNITGDTAANREGRLNHVHDHGPGTLAVPDHGTQTNTAVLGSATRVHNPAHGAITGSTASAGLNGTASQQNHAFLTLNFIIKT